MIRILPGDCRDVLQTLPANSVQCVVTSPPYFGLRDYGVDGQIGQEATPDDFVAALVQVFGLVRRVLRDDGVIWLNLGDSYASTGGIIGRNDAGRNFTGGGGNKLNSGNPGVQGKRAAIMGNAKHKDLLMIPARVALALQADGWYLRSDIIWHKPNPMPESCRDRPTSAHEHVFLLTKLASYFYDADAIREEPSGRTVAITSFGKPGSIHDKKQSFGLDGLKGANARNVWTIATQPYSGSHFATMPPDLAERCIRAGSRPGDTILDPFSGAGTTALVADRLGRHAIGIDLNPEYSGMARNRLVDDAGLFADVT